MKVKITIPVPDNKGKGITEDRGEEEFKINGEGTMQAQGEGDYERGGGI